MSKKCPTCGQNIGLSEDDILRLLRSGTSERSRDLYKSRDGDWFITYGGGPVSDAVVKKVVRDGRLVLTYDECADSYTVGKTIAVQKTLAARKDGRIGKRSLVYTDGSIVER